MGICYTINIEEIEDKPKPNKRAQLRERDQHNDTCQQDISYLLLIFFSSTLRHIQHDNRLTRRPTLFMTLALVQ